MSDAPFRTRIGRLGLLSDTGSCKVFIEDAEAGGGSTDPVAAAAAKEAEAARQKAYKQGWEDCEKKMSSDIASLKSRLEVAERGLPSALDAYLKELESQMRDETIELAFKAAKAVVGAEMEGRNIMSETVAAALSPLLSLQGVRLHLNPSFTQSAASEAGVPPGVALVPDPKLAPGELIVESPQGFIDASVAGRLEALKESLLKALKERGDA